MMTQNATDYTLRHILQVAFPGFQWEISAKNGHIAARNDLFSIRFAEEEPVGKQLSYLVDNKDITIQTAIVETAFGLLSRQEETRPEAQFDRHGRYLYSHSLAHALGCIDRPIIDDWAMQLRQIAVSAFPALAITPRQPQNISTHDIDLIARFGGCGKNIRTLAADIFKHKSLAMARKSFRQFIDYKKDSSNDPMALAARILAENDRKAGWKSIFFFKAQVPGERDYAYDILGDKARALLHAIAESGAEIGLHGSYYSLETACDFNREKQRLEQVISRNLTHHRQHYLRFDAKKTPQVWEESGITHDYTLGYAEREGFRCGTCHPYPLYDLEHDRPTAVIEHPLIVMDGSFFTYQTTTEEQAALKIKQLQKTCHEVEGDFILLWHNSTVFREYENWFARVYSEVVKGEKGLVIAI